VKQALSISAVLIVRTKHASVDFHIDPCSCDFGYENRQREIGLKISSIHDWRTANGLHSTVRLFRAFWRESLNEQVVHRATFRISLKTWLFIWTLSGLIDFKRSQVTNSWLLYVCWTTCYLRQSSKKGMGGASIGPRALALPGLPPSCFQEKCTRRISSWN